MNTITTDMTFKYTHDLTMLYVEDDLTLQTQTKKFFESLFKSITVANDGQEALQKYTTMNFDIVLTDIKMPNMDGIELTKEIRKINSSQYIIVTSAYNDTEYLMEFLNLDIKSFLLKPIDKTNMLKNLYDVAKNIMNAKMVETYRKELESKNIELKKKNDELQSLVRILDTKLTQIPNNSTLDKEIDFSVLILDTKDLDELMEIEQDISGAAVLINLSENLSTTNIQVLGKMFSSYAKVLSAHKDFEELTSSIQHLSESLNNAPQSFVERVEEISILLESFIYVLRIWRASIAEKNIKKAFELHPSMINDINTIIAIIDNKIDDIETEMEFF